MAKKIEQFVLNEKESGESEELFEIEEILDMRFRNGRREYLLKWKGYPQSENTWEPEENIDDQEFLAAFRKEMTKGKLIQFDLSAMNKEENEEMFVVEKICATRIKNGRREYFLKWEDYPESESTWEPEENVVHLEILATFKKQMTEEKLNDFGSKKRRNENVSQKRMAVEGREATRKAKIEAKRVTSGIQTEKEQPSTEESEAKKGSEKTEAGKGIEEIEVVKET